MSNPTPAEICKEIGHDWVAIYDDDGEIIGRICARCGSRQGGA